MAAQTTRRFGPRESTVGPARLPGASQLLSHPTASPLLRRLKHFNVTMVNFKTDGSKTMNHFEDKFPFDEDGKHGGLPVASHKEFMRPHDVECDETPHADPGDNSTYDNAYCEVSQQIFNLGYRAVFPDVFMDAKGSKVAVSPMQTNRSYHTIRITTLDSSCWLDCGRPSDRACSFDGAQATMDHLIGDCGHAYDHTFKYPHCTGKFHYSDK